MLARSIPQYAVMREAVFELGRQFVARSSVLPRPTIVALGCSRGDDLAPFVSEFGDTVEYVGVEVSRPMREAFCQRFGEAIERGTVRLLPIDLRTGYPPGQADLTLSVLCLQFVPIEYRQRIVREMYRHTKPGGAVVLVEKVLGATADLNAIQVAQYLAMKQAHGYSSQEIERKRLSLEGVLVPVTAAWNEELLRQAGFREVDCVWRWMNFAAWVAVREA